jgi:hypothetical protein
MEGKTALMAKLLYGSGLRRIVGDAVNLLTSDQAESS